MKHFIRNIAFAAVAALGLAGSASAALVPLPALGTNVYGGTLDGANVVGPLDLAAGAFAFSGFAGASSGSLSLGLFSSIASQSSALGSMQIEIFAGSPATFSIDSLTWNGSPLTWTAVQGGFAAAISGVLPGTLNFAFSNANAADQIQITIAAVPLPAGGLLLIGGLGALALVRRRKAAA